MKPMASQTLMISEDLFMIKLVDAEEFSLRDAPNLSGTQIYLDKAKLNDELVSLYFDIDNIYSDIELYKYTQNRLLAESFNYHYKYNTNYRNFANKMRDNFDTSFETKYIPLLPSTLFKRNDLDLVTGDKENIVKLCLSSGTTGSKSVVPRDENTLMNFMSSISVNLLTIFGVNNTGKMKCFILGPNSKMAGDLWFAYVMSGVSLLLRTEYLQNSQDFDMAHTCNRITEAINIGDTVAIIGPPFRLLELSEYIEQKNNTLRLPRDTLIISAGGWKNRENQSIDSEMFRHHINKRLGIEPHSIRDIYNMVEFNTILPECEFHRKHIPPWVEVIIRDPSTNEKLLNGIPGIISILDASAFSYPAFILTEDIGYIEEDVCACGRIGSTLKIVRRMNNIETRGCAIKMASGSGNSEMLKDKYYQSVFRLNQ
jgi:long-chain-fatty-acid---luciferin-component ligase